MVKIMNKESGEYVGTISDEELQVLVDFLEEEDSQDQDYWVDAATIELLEAEDAPENLVEMLRRAIGDDDGVELAWDKAA